MLSVLQIKNDHFDAVSVLTDNVTNPLSHWKSRQHPPNSSWLAGAKFRQALPISLMFNDVEESISAAYKVH